MTAAGPPSIPRMRVRGDAKVAATLGPLLMLALGVFIGLERARDRDLLDALGGPLVPIAWGAVWAAPGLIGLLAERGRPALLLGSALMAFPLTVILFPVGVVLMISPWLCLVAYDRRRAVVRGRTPDGLIAVLCLAGGVAALASLMVHQDPRSFASATSGGSTSDITTATEAAISLAIFAFTMALVWFLSKPSPVNESLRNA